MSNRLPTPGSDNGTWGDILNSYLSVSLSSSGTLNNNVVGTNQLQNNCVTNAQLDTATQATLAAVANKYVKPAGGIPRADLDSGSQASLAKADSALQSAPVTSVSGKTGAVSLTASDVSALPNTSKLADLNDTSAASSATNNQVLSFNSSTNKWVPATVTNTTVSDATTASKGVVQLAGDLAGTATVPTVPGLASKVNTSRQVVTGTGLTGGGDLTADRTLSVTNDSTTQKVEIAKGGTLAATRKRLNFVEGSNVTITATDDSVNNKVDVTIAAIGSGGSSTLAGDTDVAIASPSSGQVLTYNSGTSKWQNATPSAGSGAGSTLYMPSGGDDSAGIQSLISTNCDILLGPGTHLINTATLKIPRNATAIRIRGCGRGITKIKLSSTAYRLFDFNKIADGDTFQNVELSDFTLDANNLGSVGVNYVLLGTLQNGSYQSHINFSNISGRRIDVINVPTDTTPGGSNPNSRQIVHMVVSRASAADAAAQNTITDITFEDMRMLGGNQGLVVGGTTSNSDAAANVYYDRVTFRRCYHDTLSTPVNFYNSTNFFVGSSAFGGTVWVEDCVGLNAGDDGIEIDCPTLATIKGCLTRDSWNSGYLAMNFHAADGSQGSPTADQQLFVFEDCHHQVINSTPRRGKNEGSGFWIGPGGDPTKIGTVHFLNCSFYSQAPALTVSGEGIFTDNQPVKRIQVDGFQYTHTSVNSNTVGFNPDHPSAMYFDTIGPTEIDIRRVSAHIDGNVTVTTMFSVVELCNTDATGVQIASVDGVTLDTAVTKSGSGTITHALVRSGLGVGTPCSATLTARYKNLAYLAVSSSDTNPMGATVDEQGNGGITINGVFVSDSDFTRKTGTKANEILVGGTHTNVYSGTIMHVDGTFKTTLSNTIP